MAIFVKNGWFILQGDSKDLEHFHDNKKIELNIVLHGSDYLLSQCIFSCVLVFAVSHRSFCEENKQKMRNYPRVVQPNLPIILSL